MIRLPFDGNANGQLSTARYYGRKEYHCCFVYHTFRKLQRDVCMFQRPTSFFRILEFMCVLKRQAPFVVFAGDGLQGRHLGGAT